MKMEARRFPVHVLSSLQASRKMMPPFEKCFFVRLHSLLSCKPLRNTIRALFVLMSLVQNSS